jgi:DNA-directed RNA polymerase subunit RPC12/RpoP
MKCPNCSSQMFVTDQTSTSRSHVVFYRCSLCVSEHVSSQPVLQTMRQPEPQQVSGFIDHVTDRGLLAL